MNESVRKSHKLEVFTWLLSLMIYKHTEFLSYVNTTPINLSKLHKLLRNAVKASDKTRYTFERAVTSPIYLLFHSIVI